MVIVNTLARRVTVPVGCLFIVMPDRSSLEEGRAFFERNE